MEAWSPSASRRPSTRSRASRSCARSRDRQSRSSSRRSTSTATSTCAAQDVRDRVARPSLRAAAGRRAAGRLQVRQRLGAGADDRAVAANRSLRELTEIADKVVKVAARALGRRRRGADRRRPRAGDQRLGRCRPAGRLQPADHRRARRDRAAERRRARRQRDRRDVREQTLRTMGRFTDRRRLQRHRRRDASTASPIRDPRHRLRRGRHQGAALDRAPQRRADRDARDPAAVRRQHRRGDRGRQGEPRSASRRSSRRREDARSSATSRATSTPRCTRSTCTWSWAASWRAWSCCVHAEAGARRSSPRVAIPASVIATFGMMGALDFTLNSVTMLALVLMVGIVIDDAIVVLENIFRFVEEKKMTAVRGRARRRRPRSGWRCWRRRCAWWSSSCPSRSCRASPAGSSTSSASPRRWR